MLKNSRIRKPAPPTIEKAAPRVNAKPARFVFRPEVLDRVGVSYVTLWQWMRAGTFPASRDVDGQVAWLESDIDEWMLSRPFRSYKSSEA
jgi:predicted DNA-binding transcriptional regulator AlpA